MRWWLSKTGFTLVAVVLAWMPAATADELGPTGAQDLLSQLTRGLDARISENRLDGVDEAAFPNDPSMDDRLVLEPWRHLIEAYEPPKNLLDSRH